MVIMSHFHREEIDGKPTPRLVCDQPVLCSRCNQVPLVSLDYVRRICLSWNGTENWFEIPRGICPNCQTIHRMLPDGLVPYKHYDKEVISTHLKYPPDDPINSEIPSETFDLLNSPLPCNLTISNWLEWKDGGYRNLPIHPSYDCFDRNS